ncbi:MAG: ThuA domain-containing protein [Oceanicoccus sp.]
MTKFFKIICVLLISLILIGLGGIWYVGAWNLVFPSHQHNTQAPTIPSDLSGPTVLVFSKTNSFRHYDGIEAGGRALGAIASSRGWGMFQTENGAVFNLADLQQFDAVVFLNASGDMLSDEQEHAFQQWLQAGGGWLGIHAAGDDSHIGWQWYRDNLIGADFTAHPMNPQLQRATVAMENHDHPVNQGIPDVWDHMDEWYSWEKSSRGEGFTILATLDENSYSPIQKMFGKEVDLRMGDHPVVWTHCVARGAAVYTAMGHTTEAFDKPEFLKLLENSLDWVMTDDSCRQKSSLR